MAISRSSWLLLICALAISACANRLNEGGSTKGLADGSMAVEGGASGSSGKGQKDAGRFGNGGAVSTMDAAAFTDAMPTVDSFFINDPPAPYCAPDGAMGEPTIPSGTPTCPGDKNREGCPCSKAGDTAACWPGKRINRTHGVCKDGKTTCTSSSEFGLRWGACDGYVLPVAGAKAGPQACRCFSSGRWAIKNLAPCLYTNAGATYLYSSHLDSAGKIACEVGGTPPPLPKQEWSTSSLNIDCAGKFKLCYAIKAGDASSPQSSDCTIMKQCFDLYYNTVGSDQTLPNFAAWTSNDAVCGKRFVDVGGYGEMSVEGESVECEKVDDGSGNPYVFQRTSYCPAHCNEAAFKDTMQCKVCSTGGSGNFGG